MKGSMPRGEDINLSDVIAMIRIWRTAESTEAKTYLFMENAFTDTATAIPQ